MIARTLTPILSIITSILIFVFFVQPVFSEIKQTQSQIDEYRVAVDTYTSFTERLDEKLAIKNSMQAYKNERLDRLVPDVIDSSKTLVDLESLAKHNSLLFGNISVSDDSKNLKHGDSVMSDAPALLSTDVSFDVVGTYDQLKKFLLDLERSLTLYEVVELSMTASDSLFQQVSITVRVYAYEPN